MDRMAWLAVPAGAPAGMTPEEKQHSSEVLALPGLVIAAAVLTFR